MTTTFLEVKNNAKGVLADPLAAGASSLALETGDGAAFPAICPFDITVDGEILRCTDRTGDTLTVARGSQGTTPADHAAGAPVRLNVTAAHLTDLYNAVNSLEAGLNGHQVADGQVIRFGDDGEFAAGLNLSTGELEVKDESGNLLMALGPDGALSAASGEFSDSLEVGGGINGDHLTLTYDGVYDQAGLASTGTAKLTLTSPGSMLFQPAGKMRFGHWAGPWGPVEIDNGAGGTVASIDRAGAFNAVSARLGAGGATPETALLFGAAGGEGLGIHVLDETIDLTGAGAKSLPMTSAVPAGAVVLAVQGNIEAAVAAGGTTVTISLGLAASAPGKYGTVSGGDSLAQNAKINHIPAWQVLAAPETIEVCGCASGGAALGDTNLSAGAVRVRVVYLANTNLADA